MFFRNHNLDFDLLTEKGIVLKLNLEKSEIISSVEVGKLSNRIALARILIVMKISRYIKFPLIFGILVMLNSLFFSFEPTLYKLLTAFSGGAVIGIILQVISNYKTRQIESEAAEEDFSTYQNRTVSLLCSFDRAFDLCLESIENLKKGKLESADKNAGFIKAKTGMNLKSFGNMIEFKLKEVTEILTEVEISTKPLIPTTLIDYGESAETVKKLVDFFEKKNEDLAYKSLENKSDIPAATNLNNQNILEMDIK